MKYLKRYNESTESIVDILKEILLDLEDMGIIEVRVHKLSPDEISTQRFNARHRVPPIDVNRDISGDQYFISFLYPTKSVMSGYGGITDNDIQEFKLLRKAFDDVLEELYVVMKRIIDTGLKVDGFSFTEMLTGKKGYRFEIKISNFR